MDAGAAGFDFGTPAVAHGPSKTERRPAVDRTEINKLQDYLRRKFGNDRIKLQPNMRRKEMVEVMIGDEQIGTLYKDVDEGETSYTVTISILDIDLDEA